MEDPLSKAATTTNKQAVIEGARCGGTFRSPIPREARDEARELEV